MQGQEVAKIIYILRSGYPQSFQKMDNFELTNFMDLWNEMLKDYTYNEVAIAVKTYIATDKSHFIPSIGDVIDLIHKHNKRAAVGKELNENDAWAMVYKAITKANYYAEEEYNKLPEECKRAVGNPAMLREWAQLQTDEVNTVVASNFMRTFRAVKTQSDVLAKIPREIMQTLEQKREEKMMLEG